jgi:predicted RNA-binding Zn-ribbon protein involved in translation (DUF1610 family)
MTHPQPEPVSFCPHCGTNSQKNTIRCQEQYQEFSMYTCYNCGKSHIRDVTGELLKLVRSRDRDNRLDEIVKRIASAKRSCDNPDQEWAYEYCIDIITELRQSKRVGES